MTRHRRCPTSRTSTGWADTVDPPEEDEPLHTTYRLAEEPDIGVLWTYAEPRNGVLTRVGGGTYDAATDTYGQGAFNADDVARAAVVYIRHWVATGSPSSRDRAYEMLRGLTYLQTASGDNAGNVVLWMQPDGTLNPSADPVELPDPSDSDASYWVARTLWALGEGYAAFAATGDPADEAFAGFLRDRMELSIDAVNRQVLDTYGQLVSVDGRPTPSWLIADGADASAEAVLGLAAYVEAGGGDAARTALSQLADGIAMLSEGTTRTWPFGAVYPWALSRSLWHAWGSQMPAALSRASQALGTGTYLAPAVKDSAGFTPWMLTSGGPDNGRLPTRLDQSQIAYGADSRVQSLLATAEATGKVGLRRLAGMQAAWFFGANAAGVPAYDPATGRTIDGISGDGVVNANSGAESTIHGLLDDDRARRRPRRGRGRSGRRPSPHASGPRRCRRRTPAHRCRPRRHAGGPVDGRVTLRRDGLPRPGRRLERLTARAWRRRGPPGDAGGRPDARQHGRHHPARRRQSARPRRVGRHRSAGSLSRARSAAPGDAVTLPRQGLDGPAGGDLPPPAATRPGWTR